MMKSQSHITQAPRPCLNSHICVVAIWSLLAFLAVFSPAQQVAARAPRSGLQSNRQWTTAGEPDAYAAPDERTGHLFVVVENSNTLVMVNMRSGTIIRHITLGGLVYVVAACPAAQRIIALVDKQGIVLLDSSTGAVVHTTHISGFENGLAVAPKANRVIAFGGQNPAVVVLNARTGAIIAEPPAGITPTAVGIDEKTNRAFVLSINDNLVSILDLKTGTLIRAIGVPLTPQALALDAAAGRFYVVSPNEATVQALGDPDGTLYGELSTQPHRSALGDSFFVDHAANRLLIVNSDATATILTEHPFAQLQTVAVGRGYLVGDVDTQHGLAYLASGDAGVVGVVDMNTASVRSIIQVPPHPRQVLADGGRGYVVSEGSSAYRQKDFTPTGVGYLSAIDGATNTLIGMVPAGAFPTIAARSALFGRIFVTSYVSTYPSLITLDLAGHLLRTVRLSSHPFVAGHD